MPADVMRHAGHLQQRHPPRERDADERLGGRRPVLATTEDPPRHMTARQEERPQLGGERHFATVAALAVDDDDTIKRRSTLGA